MRTLNCRTCGKMLIELEKGKIASKGLAVYCLEHDPAKATSTDWADFLRGFGKR